MKALTPFVLLALTQVGCDEAAVAGPETAGHAGVAAVATSIASVDASGSDRLLRPPEDYILIEDDDDRITLSFFDPTEGILSVHSTTDVFSCGTPLKIMPLTDRLVATPLDVIHLNRRGTLFTRVYGTVTPTGLDDFLADPCLFMDTTAPVATGTARLHFTRVEGTPLDRAPYTLTISGTLCCDDSNNGEVHLTLLRVWAWPTSWKGPSLRNAEDGGV